MKIPMSWLLPCLLVSLFCFGSVVIAGGPVDSKEPGPDMSGWKHTVQSCKWCGSQLILTEYDSPPNGDVIQVNIEVTLEKTGEKVLKGWGVTHNTVSGVTNAHNIQVALHLKSGEWIIGAQGENFSWATININGVMGTLVMIIEPGGGNVLRFFGEQIVS